jgi:ubiquitin-protein ligase
MAGPAGTPYHDGLFFFDIKLPPGYPATPPQARILLFQRESLVPKPSTEEPLRTLAPA